MDTASKNNPEIPSMKTRFPIEFFLMVKVIVTLSLWSIPLLLFTDSLFVFLGIPTPAPSVVGKLLGMSYLSLCFGYFCGMLRIRQGKNADGIIWMGLISNAGASLFLFLFIISDQWNGWSIIGRAYIWFSAIATLFFAFGMAAYLFLSRQE